MDQLSSSEKDIVRCRFNAFLKVAINRDIIDYKRHLLRQSKKEPSCIAMSDALLSQLFVMDKYPVEQYHFQVHGIDIAIENESLADALADLSEEKRQIILLSYFLEMTDKEIAEQMNLLQRTVQRRRASSLLEMKKEMNRHGNKAE